MSCHAVTGLSYFKVWWVCRFAADALVYAGDAVNIFASLKNDKDALGYGYGYDFCPTEMLVKADVLVNGRHVGTTWTYPFEVEIPRDVIGENVTKPFKLEVRVTNLWPNRLIADSALPVNKRLMHTNINPYKSDFPLLRSGLFGPVTLVCR